MRSRTVTTVLEAPKSEVFAYLADVDNLPDWAQVLAQFNPLYHCVQLVRHAAFGFEGWIDLYHVAVIVAFGLLMWRIAIFAMERKLVN